MNILNKKLEKCSTNIGYYRDGFCNTGLDDTGKHTICAIMNKDFLDFTKKKGNNLDNVVKPQDRWCLCEDRWEEAFDSNLAPPVILNATNIKTKKRITNKILLKKGGSNKTKKQFLFNPNNPKKSFDVYIDKDPSDTIPIKYTTEDDVIKTINKLERLYKAKKYSHKRIWQVGMILKVRLEAMKKHKKKLYPNAKNVITRFNIANKYFKFLKKRTKKNGFKERKKLVFKL